MGIQRRWLIRTIRGGIKWGVPVIILLFGNALIPRMIADDKFIFETSEKSARENITVVSFRRGNGGYKTFGDVGAQAEALGFKSIRWMSKGMVGGMERGWGVPPLLTAGYRGLDGFFLKKGLSVREKLFACGRAPL